MDLKTENEQLKAALRAARRFALKHKLTLADFSKECGVTPLQMSQWTETQITEKPDFVCSKPKAGGIRLSAKGVESDVDEQKHVEDAKEQCERILEKAEEIPDAGYDFAESVSEKCSSILVYIEKFKRVTPQQREALSNMEYGVDRWLRD